MGNGRGRQWLVAANERLANLRPFRVRVRLRNALTVVLDSLYGLPLTSRMGRGKQPKQLRALPRLLPVGEQLPLEVQEQLRRDRSRRSHPSTYSDRPPDLTSL